MFSTPPSLTTNKKVKTNKLYFQNPVTVAAQLVLMENGKIEKELGKFWATLKECDEAVEEN